MAMNSSSANSTTPLANWTTASPVTTEPPLAIGGIVYFYIYLSEYLPYTVLSAFGVVVGVLGNVLIIGAVLCTKELQTMTNMLVFNLSLADLVISGFVDSWTIAGVFLGKSYFDERIVFCKILGAICLIACETSLISIGFLAFNRYIHICYHNYYSPMFTKRLTILYCLITWMIGVAINIPNVAGWGDYFYDYKTLNCIWDRLASQSYSIFFPMSSIITPCVCILFFYVRIFMFANKTKLKVTSSTSKTKDLSKSLRIAKGLFASFVLFTICWLPYGMIVMLDYQDQLPRTAHMFSMAVAHLNSSLNPVLYALTNPLFQKGYRIFIRKVLFLPELTEQTKAPSVSYVKSAIQSN